MVALCRLCASLKKCINMTYIRDSKDDLCIKISKCCHLTVDLSNPLPKGVCPECVQSLNASFEFYERVHESQQSLEKVFNVQSKTVEPAAVNTPTPSNEQLAEERKSLALISAAVGVTPLVDCPPSPQNEVVETNSLESEPLNDTDDDDADVKEALKEIFGVKIESTNKDDPLLENEEENSEKNIEEVIIINDNEEITRDELVEEPEDEEYNFDAERFDIIEVYEDEEETIELQEEASMTLVEDQDDQEDYEPPEDFFNEVDQDDQASSSKRKTTEADDVTHGTWKDYAWECVQCVQAFPSAQELVDHKKNVEKIASNDVKWFCIDCLKIFPRHYSLVNHVRQRHRPYLAKRCDICDERCESFKDLEAHRQSMHGHMAHFVMFLCTTCGKGFNTSNSLQIHSKCHLPDDVRLRYGCNLCDKKFRSSSNLKFHQKLHAGSRDFVCDQCGKKFIQKSNLEEHLVTHASNTPYECDICNKQFKTSERLLKHKQRHTDEKPFPCDQCEKTFRTKDAMKTHTRIHTGEMPFQCEFCQKPFRFRSTLMTHHNVHTGIRPYSCVDCDHHFTNWPNYNKHMKRKHGVDVKSKNPRGKKPSNSKANPPKKSPIKGYNIKMTELSTMDVDSFHKVEEDEEEEYEEIEGGIDADVVLEYESD